MKTLKQERAAYEIFTRREAADYLRVCLTTLDKMSITSFRIGKRVLFRKSVIDQWIEKEMKKENDFLGVKPFVKGAGNV